MTPRGAERLTQIPIGYRVYDVHQASTEALFAFQREATKIALENSHGESIRSAYAKLVCALISAEPSSEPYVFRWLSPALCELVLQEWKRQIGAPISGEVRTTN